MATSSFIGRDAELGALGELLRHERLVTLTGSGGSGKTRLAQHLATDVLEDHPGGVWWVELATVADGANVADRVASSLGLTVSPSGDLLSDIVAHLRARERVLVVLDNAEHVLNAVAGVVDAIVGGCPDVGVLITSREPLGSPQETIFRLPSLASPGLDQRVTAAELDSFDGVRLFLDRARQARPNLVVEDHNAHHVAAICARLDGIPLALELAAARARTLPLDRLAGGLNDTFRLLTGGSRTALARQQTLRASIRWSVDLLDEVEQAVLRRLAVFRDSFTLDAAEAVAADETLVDPLAVLDVVGRLVDKSLVQLDDATDRYRLLQTIRQFAFEQLIDAGELSSTSARHCRWCCDWARAHSGMAGLDLTPSSSGVADVFAALDWAYDNDAGSAYRISRHLAWSRNRLGHFAEFTRQYDWVAARDGSDDPAAWAEAVAGLAVGAVSTLRYDFAALAERALQLAEPSDRATRRLLRWHVTVLGPLHSVDLAPLAAAWRETIEDGDDVARIRYSAQLAIQSENVGNLDEVEEYVGDTMATLKAHGSPVGLAAIPNLFGAQLKALAHRGRLSEARELAAHLDANDRANLIPPSFAAWVGHLTGDHEIIERAGRLLGDTPPRLYQGPAAQLAYYLALHRGRTDETLALARTGHAAMPIAPVMASFALVTLAVELLQAGLRGELQGHLDTLITDLARTGNQPAHTLRRHLIEALLARHDGRTDDVEPHAQHLLAAAMQHGYLLYTIDALELLAEAADQHGHEVRAARLLGATTAARDRIGYVARSLPDPTALTATVSRLGTEQPAAFAEGAALSIEDAAEYARRGFGERGRPTHGWASLTPTETKVAELVSGGSSNEQVARTLLMSPATVKTHLTHIYAKTAIANRTELAARWGDR